MWVPILGVVCVGLFISAVVAQFTQHHNQHSSDGEGSQPGGIAGNESADETESE